MTTRVNPMARPAKPGWLPLRRHAQDDNHKNEGRHNLKNKGSGHRVFAEVAISPTVLPKTIGGQIVSG